MANGVVGEVDAVEGLGEGLEGALAALGLELTLPDGDAVPSHGGYLALFFDVALLVAADFLLPEVGVCLGHLEVRAVVVSISMLSSMNKSQGMPRIAFSAYGRKKTKIRSE